MKTFRRIVSVCCAAVMAGCTLMGIPVDAEELIPMEEMVPGSLTTTDDPCDIDQDGDVDLLDAVKLNRYLMGDYYVPQYSRLDCNRNGIVDAADSLYILTENVHNTYSACFINRTYNSATGTVTESEVPMPDNSTCLNSDMDRFTTDARAYKKYIISTGATSTYYLSPDLTPLVTTNQSNADSINQVIGTDDRYATTLSENTGIVKISVKVSDGTIFGTGFIVSDHIIATAAHVVKDVFSGKQLTVTLHNSDGTTSNTNLTPLEVHMPLNYLGYDTSRYYDYALIYVSQSLSAYPHFSIGNTYNTYSYNATNNYNNHFANVPIYVTGNPGEVSGVTNGNYNLYSASGYMLNVSNVPNIENDRYIHIDTDATDGDSGAPVYTITKCTSGNSTSYYYTAIAVLRGDSGPYTQGVRFTKLHQNFYLGNENVNN